MPRLVQIATISALALATAAGPAAAQPKPADPPLVPQPAFTAAQQDLRSPDAHDSARQITAVKQQDLRSPDARDAAVRPVSSYQPGAITTPVVVRAMPSNRFNWGDAGIGAAGMLALIALGSGTMLVAGQRKRTGRFPAATH